MKRELSNKERHDLKTLAKFATVYCHAHHKGGQTPFDFQAPGFEGVLRSLELCEDCAKLLRYGFTMRVRCPHDPKPMCKKCPDRCYKPEYRARIREVMKFSGMYLLKRGRVDLLFHYFR
jgi:hypothetical protein